MSTWDYETDVVVVGSGSAGLTTAWTAAQCGLDALVIEKTEFYGGNSAMSGGGAWMPNAPELIRQGQRDEPAKVVQYLRNIAPDIDRARHERFVEECSKVAAALETTPYFRNGYYWGKGYSDYHPSKGGNPLGRGIWPNPIDLRTLKEERSGLRGSALMVGAPKGMWMTSAELSDLIRVRWGASLRRYKMMAKMAWRKVHAHVTGAEMLTSGRSLVARLRLVLRDAGVPLWLKTPMKSLIVEQGVVVGVNAEKDGKPIRIRARRGVMIAAGGFEFSEALRKQYQPLLGGIGHSHGSPGNTGDGIMAGAEIGAAIDLMDDSWWMPAIDTPGAARPTVMERQAPNQFIVNIEGKRFVNESGPYTDFGHAVLAGQARGVDHTKFYMIMDHEAWTHNLVASHVPGMPVPQAWLDNGTVTIADTMDELARKIGVPSDALVETAARFNAFATKGRDDDFHRGESAYDNFYGDHRQKNPNLREVDKPPYYAFRMVLGDLGTKGGLVTNENAQVLDQQGRQIPGLYAAGNSSASMMGHSYAGPGATIGPADDVRMDRRARHGGAQYDNVARARRRERITREENAMPVPKDLLIQPDRGAVRADERQAYDRVVGRQTFYGYSKGTPGYPFRPKGQEAGPYFGVLLNAPLIADHLSELGVYYRSRGEVPNSYEHKDREWVDIVLGEHLGFNMWGHILDGIAVGVRPEAVFAVLEHRDSDLSTDERMLAQYIRRLADGALEAADWTYVQEKFGTRGAVEFSALIAHLITTIRLIQAFMSNHAESNEELAARLRKFIADGDTLPDPTARVPKMEYEEQAS